MFVLSSSVIAAVSPTSTTALWFLRRARKAIFDAGSLPSAWFLLSCSLLITEVEECFASAGSVATASFLLLLLLFSVPFDSLIEFSVTRVESSKRSDILLSVAVPRPEVGFSSETVRCLSNGLENLFDSVGWTTVACLIGIFLMFLSLTCLTRTEICSLLSSNILSCSRETRLLVRLGVGVLAADRDFSDVFSDKGTYLCLNFLLPSSNLLVSTRPLSFFCSLTEADSSVKGDADGC